MPITITIPWPPGDELVVRCVDCGEEVARIPLNIDHQHGGDNGPPVSGP